MPRHGKPRSERIVCYASYVAVPAGQRMMASTVSAAGAQMRIPDLDGGKRYISRLVFIYGSTYMTGTADGVDMHACVTLCHMCEAILPRDHGDGTHTVSQTAKNILCSIVDG